MNLADIFEAELAKLDDEKCLSPVRQLGKMLAEHYRQQQETLAGITTMYVRTFNELDDLKKRRADQ